jgi:hypothetical protein
MELHRAILSLLVVCSFGVKACGLYELTPNPHVDSLVLSGTKGVCYSKDGTLSYAENPWLALSHVLDDRPSSVRSYWEDWVLNSDSNPLITQSISNNYFGLGVWMPHQLEDDLSTMSTEQWLKSHGVQFSLGFGDRRQGQPRMRLDYRWHEEYEGDVMMQVEVPF